MSRSAVFTVPYSHPLAKSSVGRKVSVKVHGTISSVEGDTVWVGDDAPALLGENVTLRIELEQVETVWSDDDVPPAQDRWDDPYHGVQEGIRCGSHCPSYPLERCQLHVGHTSMHRFTSGADGRSESWE